MAEHPPFYVPDGDAFIATEHTRGPWSADHQHAGPPSGLMVRAAEALCPGMDVARFTGEMLRPIPIGPVRVDAVVEKAGKKSSLVRATLVDVSSGKPCISALIACVRTSSGGPELVHAPAPAMPSEAASPFSFPFFSWPVGYHTAMELRVARGRFGVGDMAMWMRQRGALVAGEEPTGAQRALVVADAGSGVSIGLDSKRWSFVNADLSVHLLRAPVGPWLLVDARTTMSGNGRGLADTALWDAVGPIGRVAQTLVVEARAPVEKGG